MEYENQISVPISIYLYFLLPISRHTDPFRNQFHEISITVINSFHDGLLDLFFNWDVFLASLYFVVNIFYFLCI